MKLFRSCGWWLHGGACEVPLKNHFIQANFDSNFSHTRTLDKAEKATGSLVLAGRNTSYFGGFEGAMIPLRAVQASISVLESWDWITCFHYLSNSVLFRLYTSTSYDYCIQWYIYIDPFIQLAECSLCINSIYLSYLQTVYFNCKAGYDIYFFFIF